MSFLVKTPKLSMPAAAQQQMASYREADPVPLGYGRGLLPAHWLSDAFNWREAPAGQNSPAWQYASIAFALGAGPIDRVGIMKQDGKLGWDFGYTFAPGEDYHDFVFNASLAGGYSWWIRIYRGSETQTPDAALIAGTGQNHPAYRGLAYAVMHNISLGQGNTTIPSFAIECGRNAPAIGSDYGAGSDHGVNPFAAIYGLLLEDRGGDCEAGLLDAVHWGAQADALWAGGIHARTGEQVLLHPWFSQGTNLADAISQILAYCDGYIYAEDGKLRAGWFPGGAPGGSLPAIGEADLEFKPSGGGFPDWNQAATSVAVVFTDAIGRHYEDGSATYQAPANRETGTAAAPQRKDRPFVHFADQAQSIATEMSAGTADDTGVNLQVLKSAAVRLDDTPLQPGDLFTWVYGPHGLALVCRVVSRRIRAGAASDLLEVIRERGAFPAPHVPAVDEREPYVPVPPVDVANHRLWFLPPGFGGARQITCLVDRPAPQNISTRLHLSSTGAAPWEEILTLRSFAARCAVDAGGLTIGAAVVRVASSSLDFARMQAQSTLAQKNDTLLLLIDDELLSVGAITVVSPGVYDLAVLRGRQGSEPAAHAGAAAAWLCYYDELQPTTHSEFYEVRLAGVYDAGTATKYFKLQAVSADAINDPAPNDPGISWQLPDLDDATEGARTFYGPTAPVGDLRIGDLWFMTVDGEVVATFRWDGSAWVDVSDSRIPTIEALIASVQTQMDLLADEADALAADLLAEVAAREAAIISEASTRSTADGTITSALDAVTADYNANKATVASQISALASENSTQASQITALQATDGTHSANISSLSTALTNEETTRASQVTSLQSQINGLDSTVDVLAAAYIVGGVAIATWGFKLDAGGKVVGMQAIAASGGSQPDTGVIVFSGADMRSDNFSAGSSGWIIRANGTIEFASGVIRCGLKIGNNSGTPGYGGDTTTGLTVEESTYAMFISRADVFGLSLNRNGGDGAVAIFNKGASQVGAIQVTGSATSYITSSDRRLKTAIRDVHMDCGALLDQVRIREFEFLSEPGKLALGVIAQELVEVWPAAVSRGDNGATIGPEGAWGVDYSKLVPLLVREIQSLRERVAHLEAA